LKNKIIKSCVFVLFIVIVIISGYFLFNPIAKVGNETVNVYELIRYTLKNPSYELERLANNTAFDKVISEAGVEVSDEVVLETCRFFRDTSTEYLKLYPWSLPILEKLKANGKKVFLLSNAQRSFTYHEMEKLDIVKYFDAIYISSDYGVKKPNVNFFKTLIEKEGLDVSKCLMLGNDQTCDILGAQGMGMDTWYVHTNCSPEYTKDVKATYEFL